MISWLPDFWHWLYYLSLSPSHTDQRRVIDQYSEFKCGIEMATARNRVSSFVITANTIFLVVLKFNYHIPLVLIALSSGRGCFPLAD